MQPYLAGQPYQTAHSHITRQSMELTCQKVARLDCWASVKGGCGLGGTTLTLLRTQLMIELQWR